MVESNASWMLDLEIAIIFYEKHFKWEKINCRRIEGNSKGL